jgi:oligopeptide transport system substrate-binding protein
MMQHLRYAVFLWLLAAVGLAACQPPAQPPVPTVVPTETDPAPTVEEPTPTDEADGPSEPASVSIAYSQPPATLDPGLVAPLDAAANDLVDNLFVGLTRLNPDTGTVEPWLAREWQQMEDGLTWHVFLRDDVYWVRVDADSGEIAPVRPVSAADVVYAASRACRSDTGAPLGSTPGVFAIQGCRDLYERDPSTITDVFVEQNFGARVLNDVAVEFKLTGEIAAFPAILSMPMLRPVPQDLVEEQGDAWTEPSFIWTSGPFALSPSDDTAIGFSLVANDTWSLARSGNLEAIQINYETAEEAYAAWQNGDLDVAPLPASEIGQAVFGADSANHQLARPVTSMLIFAYDTPPLDNPDVRRALSLSVDRDALAALYHAAGEGALPATGIVPPGMAAAPPSPPLTSVYDPAVAREALVDAGYEGCADLPPITLLIDNTSALSRQVADAVIGMWNDTLGCVGVFSVDAQSLFDVSTALQEPASPVQPVRSGVMLLGWQGDYPDAHHWLADIFACKDISPGAYVNQARSCAEAESNLSTALLTEDIELRRQIYADIQSALFGPGGEMPVVPLVFFTRALAVQPWVEYYPTIAGTFRWDEWVIHEDAKP